jgi:Tfp pilus assembly protein PilF
MGVCWAGTAVPAPFVPENDAVILERLPSVAATRQLEPLRRRVASDPQDVQSVLALAEGYLKLGRETADPRFTSYAEAALAGWVQRPDAPPAVLVLAATAEQSSHRFGAALALLDRALHADPANGQAWLTKATILQVQGDFAAARVACGQTLRTAGQLIGIACLAGVNGMTGRLAEGYATLKSVYVDDERLALPIRTWILGQLGEFAERLGDQATAERYFRAALQVAPRDVYLKTAYADLLLTQRRYDAVLQLLRGDEALDNLLLRLAIAGQYFSGDQGNDWARTFEARYEAARRDGDFTHLREQALFLLAVRQQPREALALAERNWEIQHEPADVRLYVAAASASRDALVRARVAAWIKQTGYEDPAIGIPLRPAGERSSL